MFVRIIFFVACFGSLGGSACVANQSDTLGKAENVKIVVTDAKGKKRTVSMDIKFPTGPGNTGAAATSTVIKDLSKKLKDKGCSCVPKRQKIADNIWICGDGTKYVSTNKKLNALLEEIWSEEE